MSLPMPTPKSLDNWARVYEGPSATPFVPKLHAAVFRGMRDLPAAKEYAEIVRDFFSECGRPATVFVVRGPTSTTAAPFEVVSATAGYAVEHKALPESAPAAAPRRLKM